MLKYTIHVLQRFNKQEFCCQGIYELEPELLATMLEDIFIAILHKDRHKYTNIIPKIEYPR
jgi:hypothetical protein